MMDTNAEKFIGWLFVQPPSRVDWLIFLILLALVNSACLTGRYSEMDQCPLSMDDQQKNSGVVRCRALCSSYNQDFHSFGDDCHCNCAGNYAGGSPYRPIKPKAPITGQM